MAGVFISYRRDDSAGWAGRLATDLEGRFGADTVFQDIEAIGAGEDFVQAIDRALGSCSVALVLIGPDWAAIKGKNGVRRLGNPADTVRLEVTQALQREDLLVVPVLLGGARMPEASDLPQELQALARRNALELSDSRWNYDLEGLIETLTAHAGLVLTEKPPTAGSRPARVLQRFALPGLALVVAMAALTYLWLGPPPSSTTFDVFSIDRPASDERLPLGASQTWMLEGRLQLASGAPASGGAPTIDVVEAVALLEATLQVRRDRPQFRPPDLEPQRFRTLFAGQYPRLRQHRRHRVSAFRYLHRHALILGLTRTRQVPRRDCHAARKSYPDPVCRFELSLRVR